MPEPKLYLQVAPELGPLDVPADEDWTLDLTPRIMSWQYTRGRADQTAKFGPARVTAVLDNSDRKLDPKNPDGDVSWDDDVAMPLCPVRCFVGYDPDDTGTETYYPLGGRMFLGPEAWRCNDSPHGSAATVDFEAMDAVALFANLSLTDGLWSQVVAGMIEPDIWIRGSIDGTWANEVDGGATYGGIGVAVGTPVATYLPSLLPPEAGEADGVSWSLSPAGCEMQVQESWVFPSGDVDDSTFAIVWRAEPQYLAGAGEQVIASVYDEVTDRYQWKLDSPASADIRLRLYSGGSVINTLTAPARGLKFHWDRLPHTIAVVIEGGTRVSLWVDGVLEDTKVSTIPPQSYAGTLITSGSSHGLAAAFDEVIFVRRAITNDEAAVLTGFVSNPNLYRGDSLATRVQRFYDVAGWTKQSGEEAEWHPAPTTLSPYYDYSSFPGYVALWGMGDLGSTPTTLGGALSDLADGIGGDIYSLRDGKVRIRSILAVESSAKAADYDTLRLIMSDEVSVASVAGASRVRRGPVQRTGSRLDRVINISQVSHGVPDQDGVVKAVVHEERDATSIARYGQRAVSQALLVAGAGHAEAIAARTVARQKKPPIEMEQITIYLSAMGFPSTNTTYLLGQIELEKKVRVIYTPSGLDPVTIDSQIQGETWTWLPGNDVTVTLNLAQS
jgi:hypothetical protein